jgi:alpha-beta hydrolase superfamily lysophospholipase
VSAPLLSGTSFPGYEVVPSKARATFIVVHGIAEHGARYRHAMQALADRGIACFIYDQRGHGLTPGARTHVEDFGDFAADLKSVAAAIGARHPNLPRFIWGHSMGSVIVTLAALDARDLAQGFVTSGSALDALPALTGPIGAGLNFANRWLPRLRIPLKIDATLLTQEKELQREHMQDPLVPRSASLRLLHGFALACARCKNNLSNIVAPWLAIHGAADTVCPVSGSRRLIEGIGSSDKELIVYPGLLHEPHNESEAARSGMFDAMARFILSRAAPFRSAGEEPRVSQSAM